MKLYQTFPAHFVSYTPLVTAQLCGVHLENVYVAPESELAKDEAMKTKKAHWNFPVCETAHGQIISQSVAVAQYIAREAGRTDLYGNTSFEQAQIDQFCCIAQASIGPHSYKVGLTTLGWIVDPAAHAAALKDVKEQLKILNDALAGKDFLVGNRFTIADMAVWVSLFMPFTLSLDAGFRKAMPHVSAWFERVSKLPEVVKIAGAVKLPAKGLKPASA
jgi:glutathione S-transferase